MTDKMPRSSWMEGLIFRPSFLHTAFPDMPYTRQQYLLTVFIDVNFVTAMIWISSSLLPHRPQASRMRCSIVDRRFCRFIRSLLANLRVACQACRRYPALYGPSSETKLRISKVNNALPYVLPVSLSRESVSVPANRFRNVFLQFKDNSSTSRICLMPSILSFSRCIIRLANETVISLG